MQEFSEQDFRDAFDIFDSEQNGFITISEFRLVLTFLSNEMTDNVISELFAEADPYHSGVIQKDCFVQFLKFKISERDPQEDIMSAFMVFDRDGDGFISKAELQLISSHADAYLSEVQIEEMMKTTDRDGDGQISYEDFRDTILGITKK